MTKQCKQHKFLFLVNMYEPDKQVEQMLNLGIIIKKNRKIPHIPNRFTVFRCPKLRVRLSHE